jgi:uncharacterized repeat protein (TIGR02543 family)
MSTMTSGWLNAMGLLIVVGALSLAACVASTPTPTPVPDVQSFTRQEVKRVDFGSGANYFSIKAASSGSGGEVELRLDRANGPVIGRAYFHHTGSQTYFLDYEAKLNQFITGQHDVYVNFQDYSAPTAGGILKIGDFKFSMTNTNSATGSLGNTGDAGLHVYDPVPGLDSSPYYEIRVQEKSKLNSASLTAVTNWQTPFAWFTECAQKSAPDTFTDTAYYAPISGWSHTFTNFELTPGTTIVVKISRKATNSFNAPVGPIRTAVAYPKRHVLSTEVMNGDVYVTMNKPAQVSIDIDGQMDTRNAPRAMPDGWGSGAFPFSGRKEGSHAVSIFANPFITPPNKNDPSVLVIKAGQKIPANLSQLNWSTLYFEPGVHRTSVDEDAQGNLTERRWKPEDQIPLISNRSYYIPGDAIVYGNFTDFNKTSVETTNVRIYGHGAISGSKILHFKSWSDYSGSVYPDSELHRGIVMKNARNSQIEGVTLLDAANHNIQLVPSDATNSIRWIKVIGWRANADAASVEGLITMEDGFFRTQDDAHYIGGANPMRRMIFWNDANGQAFRADFATSRMGPDYRPDYPQQIVIEDIDILYARGMFNTGNNPILGMIGANGGTPGKTLPNGALNTGQMIIFRNILVSDPLPQSGLFSFNPQSKIGKYAGFRLENVTYVGKQAFGWKNWLFGGDAGLSNFVFDNVSIAGQKIDMDYVNNPAIFNTDGTVSDLTFRIKDIVPSTQFTLTRTATNGSIKLEPSGSNQLAAKATPKAGYMFIGWSGDLIGTESTVTMTINRDKAITANFAPRQ